MKLPKAKEILTEFPHNLNEVLDYDQQDAIKLGIEAINYILRLRACSLEHRQARLPGETKD